MLIDVFEGLAAKLQTAMDADPDVEHMQITPRQGSTDPLRNFNPTPPSIDIYPSDPRQDPLETAGFTEIGGELLITIRARVGTVDNAAAQRLLLRFMDDDDAISIAGNLMDDQTTGGLTGSVFVDGYTGFGLYDGAADGGPLLGATWHARVIRTIT